MPKVSVLMPTYNTDPVHLREAIQSILSQTFADFEYLILDDGSKNVEQIREIVLSFTDPRIQFHVNESNLGISESRNKLIAMAKGEYLAVKDHDDVSLPKRLERQVGFLDQNPDVGVVGSFFRKIPSGKMVVYPTDSETIEELLMYDCVVEHPASMIRKSVLTDNGISYEEEFTPAEDYTLWCRLLGKTRFANLPEVLLEYRDHKGNTTHTNRWKMENATVQLTHFARTDNPGLWRRAQRRVVHEKRYRAFGFLPLMTVKKQGRRTKYLLFGCIPVLQSKEREELFKPL